MGSADEEKASAKRPQEVGQCSEFNRVEEFAQYGCFGLGESGRNLTLPP